MEKQERSIGGGVSTSKGGLSSDGSGDARDNTKKAKFWVSHRGGPFLIHKVGKCEPLFNDNAGYLDIFDTAIDQGFAPCPKCMK